MNKFFISTALAGSLLMAGCSTVPGVDPITGNPIATEVAQITAAAIAICSFEPTAATVTAILGTLIPGAAPVTQVINQTANAICAAVVPKAARLGGAYSAKVNGIPINGRFVQSRRHGVKHRATVNGIFVDGQFVTP